MHKVEPYFWGLNHLAHYDTRFQKVLEGVPAPEPAWDTMSLESSASEPALRTGNHITSDLSRRLKEWVKRPGRRRQVGFCVFRNLIQ